MDDTALLGVWPWWQWLPPTLAFFLLVPWAVDRSFAGLYPHTLIEPRERTRSLREERRGRWPSILLLQGLNAGVIGLCIGAGSWLQDAGVGHLYGGRMDLWGVALFLPQVLLVLLVFDAQFYWVHRAAHASPLLYRWLHRDHHDDRYPDTWSALIQHPLDLFLTTAMPMAWAVVLPIHEAAWLAALLVANYINIAGHSGYEVTRLLPAMVTPNGWATWKDPERRGIAGWVNTVTHHDLHHQCFHNNFSLYFTHWDRWMGTQVAQTEATYAAAASPRIQPSP